MGRIAENFEKVSKWSGRAAVASTALAAWTSETGYGAVVFGAGAMGLKGISVSFGVMSSYASYRAGDTQGAIATAVGVTVENATSYGLTTIRSPIDREAAHLIRDVEGLGAGALAQAAAGC